MDRRQAMAQRLMQPVAAAPVGMRGYEVAPEPMVPAGVPTMQAQSRIFGLDPIDDVTPRLRGQAPQTVSQTARDWATALDIAGSSGGITRGIHAYHASPHDFPRFRMDRIGTGEGHQTYGHGLYFAENPAVSGRGGSYDQQFTQKFGRPAHIYEVGLNVDPARLLDWETPLPANHPVREVLYNAARPASEGGYGAARSQAFDAMLQSRNPNLDGGGAYYQASRVLGGAPAATQAFRDAGIPGIRYLDGGSRAAGDGTRNYVMFDDSLIEILRKYGLAGLGVGLGAGAATQAEAGQ